MTINPNLLRLAGVALSDVLSNTGPADVKLGWFFKQNRDLGTKDRAFIAESAYGVLRRKSFLIYVADGDDPRKLLVAYLVRVLGMSTRDLADTLNAQQKEWADIYKCYYDHPPGCYKKNAFVDYSSCKCNRHDIDSMRTALYINTLAVDSAITIFSQKHLFKTFFGFFSNAND